MKSYVFLITFGMLTLTCSRVPAQFVEVTLDLAQPEIINQTTVKLSGKTNLPAGTEIKIRTDLTARPKQMVPLKGTQLTTKPQWGPGGKVTVTPEGNFAVILQEPHKFKTGKYRVAAQVWVYSFSMLGSTAPQSKAFYQFAGSAGANLQGPLVDRQLTLFTGHVAVTTSKEFEFRPGEADLVARKEKKKLQQYSKAIAEAYRLHQQLRQQGAYHQSANKNNLQANRMVVDYGLRIDKSFQTVRSVESQEAFFLLNETLDALFQVHYWSLETVNPLPAKYGQAETDYATAKARLDTYLTGLK